MVRLTKNQFVIKNDKDIDALGTGISQIEIEYPSFLVFELTTIINQEIVDKIQEKLRAKGVSRKVIQQVHLSAESTLKHDEIIFVIKSDYTADSGFVVATMIEYGRRAYVIYPKNNRPNPHLKYIKDGKTIFSKKSKIPEKPADRDIYNTILERLPHVQKELNKRTKKWINGILKESRI